MTMVEPERPAAITVTIATFNRRDLLERAVRSVLDERRVPIRLQVHDNASVDGTEAFMRALVAADSRVTYTRNARNIGGHANIVEGLRAVRTRYFVPLADDDFLLPGFLHDAYAIIEADASLGAVAFLAESRDEAGRTVNTWPNDPATLPEGRAEPAAHLAAWMAGSHYSWQAVLWRATVLDHLGDPYLHTGMPSDVDFQAQVFAAFPVHVVKRAGAVFFVHGGQASHGLSVADVTAWAKLFARLDATVAARGLFPAETYDRLRGAMWHRMRPSWLRAAKATLPPAELARIAISAGFRLGDWELAFHLVGELRKGELLAGEAEGRLPSAYPGRAGDKGLGSRVELTLRTMQWMNAGLAREQALAGQVNALGENVRILQNAALTVAADRNRLAAELAALRASGRPDGAAAPSLRAAG